jgi:hypothetical protein
VRVDLRRRVDQPLALEVIAGGRILKSRPLTRTDAVYVPSGTSTLNEVESSVAAVPFPAWRMK